MLFVLMLGQLRTMCCEQIFWPCILTVIFSARNETGNEFLVVFYSENLLWILVVVLFSFI